MVQDWFAEVDDKDIKLHKYNWDTPSRDRYKSAIDSDKVMVIGIFAASDEDSAMNFVRAHL